MTDLDRTILSRRQVLGGIVGTGVLYTVGRIPGAGGLMVAGGEAAGTFTASFDFVTGVADVAGNTGLPAGVPVTAITRAFAMVGEDLTLLSFTEEQLQLVNRKYPLWSLYEIPGGTYPNLPETIQTISHPNVFAVRADIPDEDVYQITKAIFENLAALHEIHKATREVTLDKALVGLGAPLHPGAARYYREQGIEIPPELTPP